MRTALSGDDWKILGLIPSEWVWRRVGDADVDLDRLTPAAPAWVPAIVPGDVQSDLRDAGEIPDPWYDRNSLACEWTSQRDWVYRKEFDVPADLVGRTVHLHFEGVDHHAHVFLNGKALGSHIGMFEPFEFDVTDVLLYGERNRLIVVVEHAPAEPEVQGQIGWSNRIRQWKARFTYWWDWCTRLVPIGIWDDIWLDISDEARVADVRVRTSVTGGPSRPFAAGVADVVAAIQVRDACRAAWKLTLADEAGTVVAERETAVGLEPGRVELAQSVTIADPALWNPNGNGVPSLYRLHSEVRTADGRTLDARTLSIGFRHVVAVANDGADRDALPYVLEVNGVRTFIKGWNWVPLDQLYGRNHAREYRRLIHLAQQAHCNLLRVWGGGLLERELFYSLCDEAGIMVWQEFMHSSSGIDNEPPSDPDYLAYIRQQAESMVPRRANHASLVLWCGGNELMTPDWKPLTNDHPTIEVLHEVVRRLDPDRLFLPTSPSGPIFSALPENVGKMHDVHGHWKHLGDPAHQRFFNTIDPMLHSEFGVEGAAHLDVLRRILPVDRLWPADETNPSWVHHGSWWIGTATVQSLFGPVDGIEAFVRASQWLQYEGLRYAVESSRRRTWRTSGTMPWQFNEAWPNACCTNAVDYYGQPKPAYWSVRNAYAPLVVSAAFDRTVWATGETFAAEAWLSGAEPAGRIEAVHWAVNDAMTGHLLAEGDFADADGDTDSRRIGAIAVDLPGDPSIYRLRLEAIVAGEAVARNDYLVSTVAEAAFRPLLTPPQGVLRCDRIDAGAGGRRCRLSVAGTTPLYGVRIFAREDYGGPSPSEGYLPALLPGESVIVALSGEGDVFAGAWNADAVKLP